MKRKALAIFGLLLAMPMAGCATDIAPSPRGAKAPAPYVYRLAADDRVRVTVYGEPQLSGEFAVNSEGRISFPLLGMVAAQGRTVSELATGLTQALDASYYKNPHLVVDLIASRPVYVLGEVNKAGQYPYQSGMTALAAVATAGGFTYRANQKIVMIRHVGEASEEREPLTADLIVQPGDTVRIKERYF
jgi:protein involved in polysaccharide export with SLBB domain